ncbi:MAG: hypothetical protein ACFFDK_20420 [Promethearchaeota archaeon]
MLEDFLAKCGKERVFLILIVVFIALSLLSLTALYTGGIMVYMMLIVIISMLFYIPISVLIFLFIVFYHVFYKGIQIK